ncbi:MAG: hypothetical protein WDO12_04605 [Pseudomonadota bacterium]
MTKTSGVLALKSGDVVEIRRLSEIEATLDSAGNLEGVPFMPEMQPYCGRVFRVHKRADKVCVETPYFLHYRRLKDTVMLEEIRCDGSAHDGCQRLCLVFWKEAWLKPAAAGAVPEPAIDWTRKSLRSELTPVDEEKTYFCQSTALLGATEFLRLWDPRQYLRDLRSGAIGLFDLLKVLLIIVVNHVRRARGRYEWNAFLGKSPKTPSVTLGLQQGDEVRVKGAQEVIATLDPQGRNRGLYFGVEMNRHCGTTLQVITPVDRMILETSGKMKALKNTVLLKGTECSGICNHGCARAGHPLWREAWLERTQPPTQTQ